MVKLEVLPDELLVRLVDFLGRRDLAKVRLLNRRFSQISTAELFRTVTLYPQWRKDDDKDERHSVDSEQDEGWTWAGDGSPVFEDMVGDHPEIGDPEIMKPLESGLPIAGTPEAELEEALSSGGVTVLERPEVEVTNTNDIDEEDAFVPASRQSSPIALPSRVRLGSLPLSRYGGRMPRWAVDRLPGPLGHDAHSLKGIMLHEKLRNHVKEVEIYTCEPHCDHHPVYSYKWFEGAWPQPTYHPGYHDCIKQLRLFPNVQGVTVHFDRHAGEDGDDNLFQDPDFQRIWLRRILSPLRGRINGLALRHYENTGDKGLQPRPETPELMSTMTGVKSFRMSVKHRETSADSGPMYKIEWILSHSPSLEELNLDRCAILYQVGHSIKDWLDDEGYPIGKDLYSIGYLDYGWSITPPNGDWVSGEEPRSIFVSCNLRWHDVLNRFAQTLKKLRTFRFGESEQWNFDGPSQFDETDTPGYPLPIMPWRDEHNIIRCTMQFCYRIWDDWDQQYRYDWKRSDGTHYSEHHIWMDGCIAELEMPPDCLQKDENALEALLEAIRYN